MSKSEKDVFERTGNAAKCQGLTGEEGRGLQHGRVSKKGVSERVVRFARSGKGDRGARQRRKPSKKAEKIVIRKKAGHRNTNPTP